MTVTTEWLFLRGYASQGGAIRTRLNVGTPEFQIYVDGDYSGDGGVGTPTTDWVFIYGRPGDELSVRIRLNAGVVELQQWYQGRFIGDGVTSTENTNTVFLLGSSAKSGDNTVMFSIIDGDPETEFYIDGAFIGGPAGSTPPPVDNTVYPDPIVTSAMLTAGEDYHAFGLNRVVEGYNNDVVRFTKDPFGPSDEEDFGLDSNGIFDHAAVTTWAGSSDVKFVSYEDQTGNGATAVAVDDVYYQKDGNTYQFGATYDEATGLLSRATEGAFGLNLNGTGAIRISNTTMPISTDGFEINFLVSMNTRKAKQPSNDTVSPAGNNSAEGFFTVGTGSANMLRVRLNGTFGTFSTLDTTNNGTAVTDNGGKFNYLPQYGQFVFGCHLDSTGYESSIYGTEDCKDTASAQITTDILAGELDDSDIVIGTRFNNSAGTTLVTGEYGDYVVEAIVISKKMSAQDRFFTQAKQGALGQWHELETKETMEGWFDELVYLDSATDGTDVKTYTGINDRLTLEWNNDGTETTNFDHTDARTGLSCVNNPDQDAQNGFLATDNYFAGTTTGTVVGFGVGDVPNNQLAVMFSQDTADGFATTAVGRSMSIGRDHSDATLWTSIADTRGDGSMNTTREFADGNDIGDDAGSDAGNQAKGKYRRNTTSAQFTYPITMNDGTADEYDYDEDAWRNNDPSVPSGKTIDAPTGHDSAHNLKFFLYNDLPLLHIGTFTAPAGYDREDDEATRKAVMLNAENYLYHGVVGSAIGHVEGDIAHNENAMVCDSDDDARIMSSHWFDNYEGSMFFFGFAKEAWATSRARKFNVGLYKMLE